MLDKRHKHACIHHSNCIALNKIRYLNFFFFNISSSSIYFPWRKKKQKKNRSQHRAIFQNNFFFKCDDNSYGLFCVVVIVIIGREELLLVVVVVRIAGVLSWQQQHLVWHYLMLTLVAVVEGRIVYMKNRWSSLSTD